METTSDQTKSVVEIVMAVTMLLSLIVIIVRSIIGLWDKDKTTTGEDNTTSTIRGHIKGIGARIIQFASVFLIIPALVILGLEKIITGEVIAAILATMAGFVLSGIGDYDKKKGSD